MSDSIRSRLVDALGDTGIDRYARKHGFMSAAALEDSLRLCVRLKRGEFVTPGDVNVMCRNFPAVPKSVIQDYAAEINSMPQHYRVPFLLAIHGYPNADNNPRVASLIANFEREDTAAEVETKLDERHRHDPTDRPRETHVDRYNRDAASRKALVARGMAANDPPPPENYLAACDHVADKLEANVARGVQAQHDEKYAGTPVDRKTDLELAYDGHSLMTTASQLQDAADLGREFDESRGTVPPEVPIAEAARDAE